MKTVGTLTYLARCERDNLEQYLRENGRSPLCVEGLKFFVFTTGKPNLKFNVTLREDQCPTIKFEEQSRPGTFVVGVAEEDGKTIYQRRGEGKLFYLDDPLTKLVEVFPDSVRMKKFVERLSSK